MLLALCNYADDNDQAWPSHATISKITGLARRTVQNNIKKLEDHGVITKSNRVRSDGSQTSCIVTLNVGMAFGAIGESGDRGPVQETAPGGMNLVQEGMAPDAPLEPPFNLQIEPSEKALVRPLGKHSTNDEMDKVFEERFWPAFPKRMGGNSKKKANESFRSAIRYRGADVEKIMAAVAKLADDWQKRVARKPADAQFIPMAATWLNQDRWDEVKGAPPEGHGHGGAATMFDLANHFENRVRETSHGQASPAHYHDGDAAAGGDRLIDG